MFERASLARVLPFATYMAFIFIADMLTRILGEAVDLRWLYPTKIAAVIAVLWYFRREYEELRISRYAPSSALLPLVAGVLVLVLWVNLDASWMKVGQGSGFDPRAADGSMQWGYVAMRIAGAALVVPVMEELFWRSFLMRWIEQAQFLTLSPSQVKLKGFVVSVILFGIEHDLWFAGVVAGVVYSLLYIRSNNLWSPIVAHGVTNGLLGLWVVYTSNWSYW